MKTRSETRRRRDEALVRRIQYVRLEQLRRGEAEPASDREDWFLDLLRNGVPVRIHDFILSEPLMALELMLLKLEEGEERGQDPLDAAPPHP